MIAQLTGLVAHVEADRCVVDVAGVGYLVQASTRTLSSLPHPPERARLLVETVVREDAILLYGFAGGAERDWFRLLTAVQGVGAKVALGVLSALSPGDLVRVVAAGERASLTRIGGVGARLADRLLTELRGKGQTIVLPEGAAAGASAGVGPPEPEAAGMEADALAALAGLGFRRAEAAPVLARVLGRLGKADDAPPLLDLVIRDCLKELAR